MTVAYATESTEGGMIDELVIMISSGRMRLGASLGVVDSRSNR
jgi:hypothetical protein